MSRRGSTLLETILFLPILFLLLYGMLEFARIIYTYYTIQKALYAIARYAGTQQGVNFCDQGDPGVTAAKNYGLTGTTDSGADSNIPNLTADLIQVSAERADPATGEITQCGCDLLGCDTSVGGLPPDFITVSIPDGYTVRPVMPFIQFDAFQLRPEVRAPNGGT